VQQQITSISPALHVRPCLSRPCSAADATHARRPKPRKTCSTEHARIRPLRSCHDAADNSRPEVAGQHTCTSTTLTCSEETVTPVAARSRGLVPAAALLAALRLLPLVDPLPCRVRRALVRLQRAAQYIPSCEQARDSGYPPQAHVTSLAFRTPAASGVRQPHQGVARHSALVGPLQRS